MGTLVSSYHHEYTDTLPDYLQIILITGRCDIYLSMISKNAIYFLVTCRFNEADVLCREIRQEQLRIPFPTHLCNNNVEQIRYNIRLDEY